MRPRADGSRLGAAAAAAALAVVALLASGLGGLGCNGGEPRRAVVLWHAYAGDERAALEESAAAYNAGGPEVPLELVAVPYDAFADKITSAIPNGNGPDLFIFAHDRIGDWQAAGLIEPIEYWVDETIAARFAFDALAAMAYRRSLYGLPLAVKSVALFWRKDLVAAPPRTTDELRAWGADLRVRDPGRYALVYQSSDLYGHAPWLHGFGGRVLADDAGGGGEHLLIASAEAAASLDFARRLVTEKIVPAEMTVTLQATMFNEGKAAMSISGPWFIGDIEAGVPWGVTTLPVISETGRPAAPFLGAEGVLMSTRATDKDAAFAAMMALTSDAAAANRARRARQVVPNLGAYDEPDIAGDAVLAAFRAQLEHTVPMPASPAMRMVWTPYKTALQAVIAQGADAGDALLGVQREVEGYLAGYGTP